MEQYFHGDVTLAKKLGSKGLAGMSLMRRSGSPLDALSPSHWSVRPLSRRRSYPLLRGLQQNGLPLDFGLHVPDLHILCIRLTSRRKPAKGETDTPEGPPEFILQRRRWLNGEFAAVLYDTGLLGSKSRGGRYTRYNDSFCEFCRCPWAQ